MNKITRGFFIAFLSAGAIYLDWIGTVNPFINTLLGLLALYFWLNADKKEWTWTGFFIGVLWFWWMSVSFINYEMVWAIPLVLLVIGFIYATLFNLLMLLVIFIEKKLNLPQLIGKAIVILLFSYIHPFGFDWFKPELMFTNSYLGIEKWQFAIVLGAFVISFYKRQLYFMLLVLMAYPYASHFQNASQINHKITLNSTHTNVKDKWKQELVPQHINDIFIAINEAIHQKQRVIVFPESVFALFLNEEPKLIVALQNYSHQITIIAGGLYWKNQVARNSTYIFEDGEYRVANKVVLVPFGEQNPLPSWMGKWVNDIFFDGAPDYTASTDVTDYKIDGVVYRNAICFEATSERLYENHPKNMIVLTNNGWLTPSIEPTQQKILLQFYSKKYGTTIYHSVNMSDSYIIHQGEVIK
jgi:apolipoprotein N-acyltransferase